MVIQYDDEFEHVWDEFVLEKSMNGNFLQTRNFLNYHGKKKFKDASIMLFDDKKLMAVVPANEIKGGTILIAHEGSTYGGIVINREYANTMGYNKIFDELTNWLKEKKYITAEFRMHNWLYSPDEKHNELCEYYFQLFGFSVRSEIGFYIDLSRLDEDFTGKFEKLKRRKLNKANRYSFEFKQLNTDDEIVEFHYVLTDNLAKFDKLPTHTVEDLLDFKNSRLVNEVLFYGLYLDNTMIAGSMVFNFCNKKVFHTQYLASRHDYLEYCPNEFLYTKLIQTALHEGYRYLSYGTASLEHGNVYNEHLGMYKEGFNTDSYMNRCYIWKREKKDA